MNSDNQRLHDPLKQPDTTLWSVEEHGINAIPGEDRHGSPRDLFGMWCGANLVLAYLITGAVLFAIGLNIWQAIAAIALGNLAYLFVGLGGIPGPQAGTSTMVISRGAFGLRGNLPPAILAWLTLLGWQAVNIVIASFAAFALAEEIGIALTLPLKITILGAVCCATYAVTILGHATIVYLETVLAYIRAVLLIGVVVQILPHVNWAATAPALAGASEVATLLMGVTLVAAMPMSWMNYPADYTRYMPRSVSRPAIVGWTFLGGVLPAVALTLLGFMAATATNMGDPIGGFKPLLAPWYYVVFLVVVIVGQVTNNFMNCYSSGLTLLAVGVKAKRWKLVPLDATIATTAAVYAIFFQDFTSSFIDFLSLMMIWISPWSAIYLVDMFQARGRYETEALLQDRGGRYWFQNGVNIKAMFAWIVGMVASASLSNSALWKSPLSINYLGGVDLSFLGGFLAAGILYSALSIAGKKLEKSSAAALIQ